MSAINDPNAVRRQYATDERIRIRQEIHEKYSVPKIDFPDWVLSNFKWRGTERVLDVGSGAGMYYPSLKRASSEINYHGADLSTGMLLKHPAYVTPTDTVLLADAQHLPYTNHSFDVIMANHMLYHVSDIDAALQEFRRVLKPDGALLIATNSTQSMPELQVLMRRAIILLTRSGASQVQPPVPASDLFALENGSRQLARHFYAVVRYDLPSALVFTDIEPLMAYLESTRDLREPQLPSDVAWDDMMVIMRQQVTHLINHLGELVINKLSGALVATDQGGFIREFSRMNHNHTHKIG
ncbi:MAG: class I SAM-dependent methyltransferase [Armatimonadetes bacterium]|nr:class I SAM-dependent methyltransferase [Anaerolineae bacterium]